MRRLAQSSRGVCGVRQISTQAFLATLQKVQQQLQTVPDRKQDLLRHGRRLFEAELLDDLPQAYSDESAGTICHVASLLRISPVKGQPYAAIVEASLSNAAAQTGSPDSVARIIHSCLVLRSPMLYEVLFTYLHPLMARAGELNAVTVAVLLNAYGRAEVHHPAFYKALCDSAAVTLKDPRIPLAHIANVAHALSRVHYFHRPLMLTLRDQAIRMAADAAPLVLVTILDAFAELDFVDDELFTAYETRLLSAAKELQPPLMSALVACLAAAGRASPATMETLGERITATASAFDPASIAKTYQAYYDANVLSEDVLGALAERACKVAPDFRADEVRQTLNALSSFDLFDGELFPLLASRMIALSKQGGYVSAGDAASILASFAAVQERNDELVHVASQLFAVSAGSTVDATAVVNALWACATLNVRNESQMQLVEYAKKNPSILQTPAGEQTVPRGESARQRRQTEERRSFAVKAYGIEDFRRTKPRLSGTPGMYRESLAGLALAATIEELSSSLALTEGQRASLWEVLDETVETCLAEAPLMSRVTVTCPPPSVRGLLGDTTQNSSSLLTDELGDTTGSSPQEDTVPTAATVVPNDDMGMAFPVYRRIDDMWTILLKDPTVEVRDESGATETLHLDYLKVLLKDTSSQDKSRRRRARKH